MVRGGSRGASKPCPRHSRTCGGGIRDAPEPPGPTLRPDAIAEILRAMFLYPQTPLSRHWRGSNSAMPMFRAFDSWSVCGRLANLMASDRNRGCTRFYPGSAPQRVKIYILLVWSCIVGMCGAVTMVHRCNLAEVEGDGVASLYELGYPPSRGRPWWLYICSQLGFTSIFCLLLQVEVLGLAGFMYPSSGLLPWQEPGRQISRTKGSYPRQ
jgi:hypothetical protein